MINRRNLILAGSSALAFTSMPSIVNAQTKSYSHLIHIRFADQEIVTFKAKSTPIVFKCEMTNFGERGIIGKLSSLPVLWTDIDYQHSVSIGKQLQRQMKFTKNCRDYKFDTIIQPVDTAKEPIILAGCIMTKVRYDNNSIDIETIFDTAKLDTIYV